MKTAGTERKSGSVMIFAVLLMTAGVFVLGAVLQLAATQGLTGDEEWAAVQRRVTLANSRSMARQHLMTRLFRLPQAVDNWPAIFTNALGGFTISPGESPSANYWGEVTTTNTNVVLNINPFNLMERGGFYREVFQASLPDGTERSTAWSFALRTRSPVTAGYSFTQQRPANNPLSSYATPPYIDMSKTNEQFFGYYGLPRTPMSSVTKTTVGADASGYRGYLDVPPGFYTNWISFADVNYEVRDTNPSGIPTEYRAVLDLQAANTAAIPNSGVWRYDVPAKNEEVPITEVKLLGAGTFADYVDVALHLVWTNTNSVSAKILTLSGDRNYRPVYLYGSSSLPGAQLGVASLEGGDWRLGITMSGCKINFETPGLTIQGGLRTDGDIDSQGIPSFEPELNPGGLDAIADRMMWLEDYRAQQ
jgi:hypothetical protein